MQERMKRIFGSTWPCACGRTHHIEPERVVYGTDAVSELPRVCSEYAAGRAAVLMDRRTRSAAGERVVDALASTGWDVAPVLVADAASGSSPVCDEPTRDALVPAVHGAGLVVSVGSGVINDLGKWLAYDADMPFVSFATAASMNGYASANVAPSVRGVKTLRHARPPRAVFTSPEVLAQAPYALTTAGLGDVLAKFVSSADWYLNHRLFGDYYCRQSVGLIWDLEPLYVSRSGELPGGSTEVLQAVFDALLLTGAAMTMAESSAPASGAEHLVSHSLDMLSAQDGRPHDLHGRQVGLGTILTAELYRRVLSIDVPEPRSLPVHIDAAFWGRLAPDVEAQYRMKQGRLREAADGITGTVRWDALREELAALVRPPELIRDCLHAAGGAVRAADVDCDRDRLTGVLAHAHEMRARFTVLDLAHLLGILPGQAEDLAAAWA